MLDKDDTHKVLVVARSIPPGKDADIEYHRAMAEAGFVTLPTVEYLRLRMNDDPPEPSLFTIATACVGLGAIVGYVCATISF